MLDSKLSGIHPFNNMVIIHWVKNMSKTERQAASSWDTSPWSYFCDLHWDLTCCNKLHLETSEIFTPPEIAVGTCFHMKHQHIFTCWWRRLLINTSMFGLLTMKQHGATREYLFLYPQRTRSGLRKVKQDKQQSYLQLSPVFISLSQSQLI